ncbi:MAG TPA: PEGA domain-containing protein [Candidatus Saccharimonadales bacterium]
MQENPKSNIALAITFIVLIVLVFVGYFAYTSITRSGKVAVEINAVPSDAKITMNGTEVSNGTIYLKPGYYEIKGSKEGFTEFTNQANIETNGQVISIPLTAESDEAKTWAKENEQEYLDLESEAGVEAQQQGEIFSKKNPIVSLLPYDSFLYTIGYRADNSDPTGNSIILEISAAEGYRQQAIYQLRQWGYDPTDFKINFSDYKNPFAS